MLTSEAIGSKRLNFSIMLIGLFGGGLLLAPSALSRQIRIDTASARAVLKALQNPNLNQRSSDDRREARHWAKDGSPPADLLRGRFCSTAAELFNGHCAMKAPPSSSGPTRY